MSDKGQQMLARGIVSSVGLVQDALLAYLNRLIEKLDEKYKEDARQFVSDWVENPDTKVIAYGVTDEIAGKLAEKLKSSGVPFMDVDSSVKERHTFIIPDSFTQQVETIALQLAIEQDRVSQISVDEINDLCFGELSKGRDPDRYCITVEDKLVANRLRETLTKESSGLQIPFAKEENADGTYSFYCTMEDCEKMNRAYFQASWQFAGRFELLNRKQEQYDLERQEALEKRMKEPGHYYIVDPEIDEKGNVTGNIKQMVEVSDDKITLYKNGKDVTEIIPNGTEEAFDTLVSWEDRQSRPIVIEGDEMETGNLKVLLKERSPKIFLEQSDYEAFKADQKDMLKAEKRLERCLKDPITERSKAAILEYIHQMDEQKTRRMGREYIAKEKGFEKVLDHTKSEEYEIGAKDLSTLDRVIEIAKEEVRAQGNRQRAIPLDKAKTI